MSYQVFKNTMSLYMSNQRGIESYEDWGSFFTNQYDSLIRRGTQVVNQVTILRGNKEGMERLVNLASVQALQVREGQHDILNNLGRAMETYWLNATLNLAPVPIIPATGAISNIATTRALVTDPGRFPEFGDQIPIDNTNIFLDQLINGIRIHLAEIKGIYETVSLYPSVPAPTSAPGIVQWQGYQILSG